MKCVPKSGIMDPKQTTLSTSGSTIGIESSFSPFDLEVNRSEVMKMIVSTKLLFFLVENPWFTEYCKYLNP